MTANENLILLGPMLRHVDRGSVTVFVALRRPAKVALSVRETTATHGAGQVVIESTADTVAIGPNLHVVAVTARAGGGGQPLAWGQVYLYDLAFEDNGGLRRLYDRGVLHATGGAGNCLAQLRYEPYPLPSFKLSSAVEAEWRVLHGSCRKPHGPGLDALALADDVLQEAAAGDPSRPQQLFLTGDQIYADDVDHEVMALVLERARELIDPNNAELSHLRDQFGDHLGVGERCDLTKQAGFTTKESASHLITRGEFCAMYLLAWSDALWPQRETLKGPARDLVNTLPKVRRALANVPTYMIFDDHETTDDWNLRASWIEATSDHPLSRRIIRNAVSAYAIFQHWGNQPRQFEPGAPGRAVLDMFAAGAPESDGTPAVDHALRLPFGDGGPELSFHYRVQSALNDTVVLDTRTRRTFDDGGYALLSAEEIDSTLAPSDKKFTVVVSAAPVLGVGLVDRLQRFVSRLLGDAFADNEPWGNATTYRHLIRRLASMRRVIVLSGDVHFAYSATLRGKKEPYVGSRIVGLVSSALKNRPGLVNLVPGGGELEALGGDDVYASVEGQITSEVEIEDDVFEVEYLGDESTDALEIAGTGGTPLRTPLLEHSNLGDVRLEPGEVRHTLWWLDDRNTARLRLEHSATFPLRDDSDGGTP